MYKTKPTKYEPYKPKSNNNIKTYKYTIIQTHQVKSSSTGDIREVIPIPTVDSKIMNEYKRRYQEHRLKDVGLIFEKTLEMPSSGGGNNPDKVVSYMGRCFREDLSD